MKTQCLQTNETQHSRRTTALAGKGKNLRSWERKKVLALIKSFIYARVEKMRLGHAM